VVERDHTVILGWNRQTLPILKQVRVRMRARVRVCVAIVATTPG
jgi:hypothetical protein